MPEIELDEPRFAADCMLGTLAKWLRILGYDTLYFPFIEDPALIDRARADGRVVLTRDRRLVLRRNAEPFILLEANDPHGQLRELIARRAIHHRPERILSRCLRCNDATDDVAPERVRDAVPPYVLATQSRYRRCPACRRVYWGATHRSAIERTLARLFDLPAP